MGKKEITDKALVVGCLEGRREAWDLLVERFSGLIHTVISCTFFNTPYAQRKDLIHEIFQQLFTDLLDKERLRKLRDKDCVRSFLKVMARHAALSKIRQIRRQECQARFMEPPLEEDPSSASSATLEFLLVEEGDPGSKMLSKENAEFVEGILSDLAPKERVCLEFHFLDEKTHQQIGAILGIPQATVSTILRRAKHRFKNLFRKRRLLSDG